VDYYQKRGVLIKVDGKKPIEQVTQELLVALQGNGSL
jgi:adenylate kinase family enzyme